MEIIHELEEDIQTLPEDARAFLKEFIEILKKEYPKIKQEEREKARFEYEDISEELYKLLIIGDVKSVNNFAVNNKRHGRLKTAKLAYEIATRIEPQNLYSYSGLGKIHYLLKERKESIQNYLRFTHLSIQSQKEMYLTREGKAILEPKIKEIPEETRDAFSKVSEDAIFVLLDENTPRHIGHAVLDLLKQFPDTLGLNEHVENYVTSIQGKLKKGVELNEETEMTFYHPLGVSFIFENLQWEQIKQKNTFPQRLYNRESFSYELFNNFLQQATNRNLVVDDNPFDNIPF